MSEKIEKIPVAAAARTNEGLVGYGSNPDAVLAALKLIRTQAKSATQDKQKKDNESREE